jgi:hypothetical protein
MKPSEMLTQASYILNEREGEYGSAADNFQLVADLSTLRLGREVHAYEVAIMLVCLKQARLFSDPLSTDSRIDSVNYELLASLFAEDYINRKSKTQATITYKKSEDLHKAEVRNLMPVEQYAPRKKAELKPLPKLDVQEAIQSAMAKIDE